MGNALARAIVEDQQLSIIQGIVQSNPRLLRKKNMLTGWLPLHFAARYATSLEVVRILVDEHAEALLVKTNGGSLPLHVAIFYWSSSEIVQYLADMCPKALLVQSKGGWLPLHLVLARRWPSLEVVQYLADKCPEALLVKQMEGWLPLHFAARYASLLVVQCLTNKCPDALLVKTQFGTLPLHVAATHAPLEVVEFLVVKKPEALLVKNTNGWLPLHLAIMYREFSVVMNRESFEVVRFLAEMCPDALPVKQKDGWLPLHVAAKYSSIEVVQYLADKCPVALLVKTNKGKLPIDIARKYNTMHPDVEEWLVWMDAAPRHNRQDPDRVSNERVPHTACAPAPDSYAQDRDRIRKAIAHPSQEPALVSVSFVESIKTRTFLGDGFFGTVYKGTDPILGHDFAIKSIRTEILRGGTKQELEAAMRTFKTEQEVREGWMDGFCFHVGPTPVKQLTLRVFRHFLASDTRTLQRCLRTPTRSPRETQLATTSYTS
jgi:ankyrin repeat protein